MKLVLPNIQENKIFKQNIKTPKKGPRSIH